MSSQVLLALPVTAAFAVLAYAFGMASPRGTLGGLLVGTPVYAYLGPQGFALLVLFVVGGSALTRLGYERKQRAGGAQKHGGRRGARNALANAGVAVLCALLYALGLSDAFSAAYVAAIGAAFADTAESEVGQLSRRPPRLITTLRKVPAGSDGAVSLPGTLAGVAAAGLVALAAFLGTVADSLVGGRLPRLGNEATNVLCTLVAAVLALIPAFFIA